MYIEHNYIFQIFSEKGAFVLSFCQQKNSLMCAFFASACEYQKPCNMVVNAFYTDKRTAKVY